jgi:hypothetical protein
VVNFTQSEQISRDKIKLVSSTLDDGTATIQLSCDLGRSNNMIAILADIEIRDKQAFRDVFIKADVSEFSMVVFVLMLGFWLFLANLLGEFTNYTIVKFATFLVGIPISHYWWKQWRHRRIQNFNRVIQETLIGDH